MNQIEIPQVLKNEKTRLGLLLEEIKDRPIGEYSLGLVSVPHRENSQIRSSRNLVMKSMDIQLSGQFPKGKVYDILDQYATHPVIQTGDHCELIYDPQTFLNNFIYHMGASRLDLKFLLTQQCSTPRMIQYRNPLIGPGVLKLPEGDYRLVNRSKKSLIRSNVATVGQVTYTMKPETPGVHTPLPQILQEMKGTKFQSAVEAFLFTNNLIWNSIKMDRKQNLVLFDESLSSDIVAGMIEDSHHPLRSLLFDPECSRVFREEIDQFAKSPECLMIKTTTDFFWGKHKEALVALQLSEDGTYLRARIKEQGFQLEFNPKSIANALRSRVLYPNLFISMLAISIFPGNTVIGGASQYEYAPEVQKILKSTIARLGLLTTSETNDVTVSNLSRMANVVSLSHPICGEILRMDKGTDFSQWESELASSTVGRALGDYSNFDYFNSYFANRRKRISKE
ncbi:MAG: hypothetical protein AAB583_03665 [Patescibacteria group bacterium]